CRQFINHGELAGEITPSMNFRMTEVAAAMAHAQLNKAPKIILDRQEQARKLSAACAPFDWIVPPETLGDCTNVFYCWAGKLLTDKLNISRRKFIDAMLAEGFPIRGGYVEPLYRMRAFADDTHYSLPVTERMADEEM